jgi:exopolysaccharide biosynthesis WecB/TagA/CpsF family protein
MSQAVTFVMQMAEKGKRCYVVTPNVDHIVRLEGDSYFREIYENANLILTDGKPLIWISRLLGTPIREKVSGSDLFPRVCQSAGLEGKRLFLLGAAEGVADKAARNLKEQHSGIQIAGTYSPPVGFERDQKETDKIVSIINDSRTDILCIGMGSPKQEMFFYGLRDRLDVKVALNIGASIDFAAGNVKRAPLWMQRSGLEWLYRLLREPKRLAKRYLIEDMKILKIVWKYRSVHEDRN